MSESPKVIASKAGKDCLSMDVYSDKEFVFVVNGVCYFKVEDASLAVRTGGNPRPKPFKVSRDGKDKFKTEEA